MTASTSSCSTASTRSHANTADRYPHQLFLIASRPYRDADNVPAGFDAFELLPDRTWFRDYLDHVGVTDRQVERAVPADAPLQDLLRLPIFAEAVATAARRGEPLPRSPGRAILSVATTALDHETGLSADREAVDAWLDGLAVVAEARHANGIPIETALNTELAAPFGLSPDERLIDYLIEKVLLVSSRGVVRFPANVVQEARAGRALLSSSGGLELLRKYAFVELEDGTRGVHPSWRHAVELLCHDAPRTWRTAIAEYDRRLAARSTPSDAPLDEREAAVNTLLDWYDERLVWWLRGGEHGQLRDDLDAVAALASTGELQRTAETWARERLNDPERTRRGNALMLLTRLRKTALVEAALPATLRDNDAVVRRIAVESHETLRLHGYHDLLLVALDNRPDELEERTLLAAYVRTAPEADVVEVLASRWPGEMTSWHASRALDRRLSRERQLRVLTTHGTFSEGWVGHLLGHDEPWTASEVELLAQLLYREARRTRQLSFPARAILRQQLAAALPVVWAADVGAARSLVYESASAELAPLLDLDLPTELRDEIAELLERRRTAPMTAPDTAGEPRPDPMQDTTSIADAMQKGWQGVAGLPHDLRAAALQEPAHAEDIRVRARRGGRNASERTTRPVTSSGSTTPAFGRALRPSRSSRSPPTSGSLSTSGHGCAYSRLAGPSAALNRGSKRRSIRTGMPRSNNASRTCPTRGCAWRRRFCQSTPCLSPLRCPSL